MASTTPTTLINSCREPRIEEQYLEEQRVKGELGLLCIFSVTEKASLVRPALAELELTPSLP